MARAVPEGIPAAEHEPLTLAYLAGVIDSDGHITVHKSTRKGVAYYCARVGIAGTRRQPHDLAASYWGGTVSRYVPENSRHRAQFQWSRSGDAALGICYELLPYLRIKEPQAWLAIDVQEHVIAGRGPDPYPWFAPDYDPTADLDRMRDEVVQILNQGRRMPLPPSDGVRVPA